MISARVAAQLTSMLEAVVSEEGTAPLAAVPGYRIAGKTGTAQRVVNGRYAAGNYTSSFIGFAPADAPRLVTAIVLQGTGKRGYYGGSTAGPVFKDVMSFALRSLQIPPTGHCRAASPLDHGIIRRVTGKLSSRQRSGRPRRLPAPLAACPGRGPGRCVWGLHRGRLGHRVHARLPRRPARRPLRRAARRPAHGADFAAPRAWPREPWPC